MVQPLCKPLCATRGDPDEVDHGELLQPNTESTLGHRDGLHIQGHNDAAQFGGVLRIAEWLEHGSGS
jgi:hypothetical protein